MRAELAIQLAQSETQYKTLNQVMRRANEIFEASGGSGTQPFPQVDVVFATFVDHLNATATQRERDLVLASDLLQRVWLTWHRPIHQSEKDSPADERDLSLLAPALLRLGLLHLLTEGLAPQHQQRIQSVAQAHNEANAKPEPAKSFELSAAERTELLDWVSACQSSYRMEHHPSGPFRALPGQLQENRESLVAYVNEILAQRGGSVPADKGQTQQEKLVALLTELGVGFECSGEVLVCKSDMAGNEGYRGFEAEFRFDSEGRFLKLGIWES